MSKDAVAEYYDANTASFGRTGQGGASIRRAVWAPGVQTRADSFRSVDARILERLRARPSPCRVVDLGCGLGASLLWLREHVAFEGIGITLSGVQARATQAAFAGADGLRCLEASYTDLPTEIADVDVAFAIESFVHAPSAEAFLAPIARALRPGGELLICDDFLGPQRAHHAGALDKTRWGWMANCLVLPDEVIALAAAHGLDCVANDDLTDFLELGRPRDRLLELVVTLGAPFKPSSWLFRSWVGGVALQKCLKKRALEYRLLRFVKRGG